MNRLLSAGSEGGFDDFAGWKIRGAPGEDPGIQWSGRAPLDEKI